MTYKDRQSWVVLTLLSDQSVASTMSMESQPSGCFTASRTASVQTLRHLRFHARSISLCERIVPRLQSGEYPETRTVDVRACHATSIVDSALAMRADDSSWRCLVPLLMRSGSLAFSGECLAGQFPSSATSTATPYSATCDVPALLHLDCDLHRTMKRSSDKPPEASTVHAFIDERRSQLRFRRLTLSSDRSAVASAVLTFSADA